MDIDYFLGHCCFVVTQGMLALVQRAKLEKKLALITIPRVLSMYCSVSSCKLTCCTLELLEKEIMGTLQGEKKSNCCTFRCYSWSAPFKNSTSREICYCINICSHKWWLTIWIINTSNILWNFSQKWSTTCCQYPGSYKSCWQLWFTFDLCRPGG